MTVCLMTANDGMSDDGLASATLAKAPTGIAGLDEITFGGLPRGRVSLVCGGPGAGKSLLALQFLVSGATEFGEPGVFVSFEETELELVENTASLGWELPGLTERGLLMVEHVHVDRAELAEAGEYDLEALFIRLDHVIGAVGAKRVALDSIEALFGALADESLLRAELRRLFDWLKDRGVTAVVTAERGAGELTRYGLEEYVSDCVIVLDHRTHGDASTRRLRIVKYRGSAHGTDEYPFMIDADGFSVFPLTSLSLEHEASSERVGSGVQRLDEMLGGGYFRGAIVLVSGEPGSGKTSLGAALVRATCERGERCLYLTMEESPSQVVRNMRSIGIDLEPLMHKGPLTFVARRASESGLEAHLAAIHKEVAAFEPTTVVIDPLNAFVGQPLEVKSTLARLLDFLKARGITVFLTTLSDAKDPTAGGVASLSETWLLLSNHELAGERNRAIVVLKSRGTAHSNQLREFVLGSDGIEIVDAYAGEGGLLLGGARMEAQTRERAAGEKREQVLEASRRELQARQAAVAAQIAALEAELEADLAAAGVDIDEQEQRQAQLGEDERARGSARTGARRADARSR
jgi:circadian clock protein KaiC